jgi:penicillin-binding protein 1A
VASATENMPVFVRPRSLSTEATRIIRDMSKRFKDAPALSLSVQKVAGIDTPSTSTKEQN